MDETFHYINYKGKTFLRLVRQKTSKGDYSGFFHDQSEARHYSNPENHNKFSILDQIDEIRRFSAQNYEFLLFYPENDVVVHWRQKISPLNRTESNIQADADIIGLELFTTEFQSFRGLMISKQTEESYLDGDNYLLSHFKYAVGVYKEYTDNAGDMAGYLIDIFCKVFCYDLYLRVPGMGITCRKYLSLTTFLQNFLLFTLINLF